MQRHTNYLESLVSRKVKLACFGYRIWALNIYKFLKKRKNIRIYIFKKKKDVSFKKIKKINPDYVLFYGWSEKISSNIINSFKCLMLHPSNLPKFRGGSPIQNQIIRGLNKTKLTLFLMNNKLDAGPVYGKSKISLSSNIKDIFKRIEDAGIKLTTKILNKNIRPVIQNEKEKTIFKRRKPIESQITISELKNKDAKYLYNKIRMLTDPYPNAFIKTKDGKKLFILETKVGN